MIYAVQIHDTHLWILTAILAIAVVAQTVIFYLISKSLRQLTVRMDGLGKDLLRNAEVVTAKVNEGMIAVKGVAQDLKSITESLTDTAGIVNRRVKDVDAFLVETTSMARLEILRIQNTIHDATRRAEETIELLRNRILAPLNEFNAISRAVRVAADVLFRQGKRPSGTSSMDEEMFI